MTMSGKHITTVTLNAAIDKTYYVSSFAAGKVNRVNRLFSQPGGKGINVARVAHMLGEDAIATGFVGGSAGRYIREELTALGIRHDFVSVAGESRVCLNVIDDTKMQSTELLEPGTPIDGGDIDRLFATLDSLAETTSVLVLSGSIPQGGGDDLYSRIIARWNSRAAAAPVLLDTSGTPLAHTVRQASPYMIKPNEEEMARLTELPTASYGFEETAKAISRLVRQGIRIVAVSLGERGSLVGTGNTIYRVDAVKVDAVNTVGCGDAYVAGIAIGLHRGHDETEMLKLASACGASNSLHERTGVVDRDQVRQFLSAIEVVPVCALM